VLQTRLDSYVSYRDLSQPDYSGNQLPLAPHLSTSLRLDYKLHLAAGDVDLQANANYKSRVFFDVSNSPYLEHRGPPERNSATVTSVPQHGQNAEVLARVAKPPEPPSASSITPNKSGRYALTAANGHSRSSI
jgi:hypothetical protein